MQFLLICVILGVTGTHLFTTINGFWLAPRNEKREDLVSGTFTWTIHNFSTFNYDEQYSDVFVIHGFKWQLYTESIRLDQYPREDYLSLYLAAADASTLPSDWSRYAKFSLTVVNQLNSDKSITKVTNHQFGANASVRGFRAFIHLNKLCDIRIGYIVNDICVVKVEIAVPKSVIEIPEGQETGELIDFRGLGRIEKVFVPLLDEVCSLHPSLIECQQNRSRMFTECAYTSLGRLLHFLKTTKAKDVTQDACERLQLLWEELETFKFDLAWLELHVQSVFGIKNRADKVNRLREEVDALENEIKRRKAMLVATEVDLENAKKYLSKVEAFDQVDMDSELGYPIS